MPELNDKTRAWYRTEVERLGAMDLSVDANSRAYVSILGLQDAVDSLAPALETTKEALKDLLDVVTKAASSAFDVLKTAVELEKTKATELYTTKLNAYNLALTSTTDSISKLTSLASTLKSTLSSLNIINSDQQQRISAQADIKAALIQAQAGGGLPLNNELTTALSTITKPSEGLFSTFSILTIN